MLNWRLLRKTNGRVDVTTLIFYRQITGKTDQNFRGKKNHVSKCSFTCTLRLFPDHVVNLKRYGFQFVSHFEATGKFGDSIQQIPINESSQSCN